jgi:hypothetical protein
MLRRRKRGLKEAPMVIEAKKELWQLYVHIEIFQHAKI